MDVPSNDHSKGRFGIRRGDLWLRCFQSQSGLKSCSVLSIPGIEAPRKNLSSTLLSGISLYDEGKAVLTSLNAQYDDIISWAEMYDTASMEAKKMIVNCLIKRIEVYRDYKLHVDFAIDFKQFSLGLDGVTIAVA